MTEEIEHKSNIIRALFNKGDFNMFFLHNKQHITGIKVLELHPNLGKVFIDDGTEKYVVYTKEEHLPRIR